MVSILEFYIYCDIYTFKTGCSIKPEFARFNTVGHPKALEVCYKAHWRLP